MVQAATNTSAQSAGTAVAQNVQSAQSTQATTQAFSQATQNAFTSADTNNNNSISKDEFTANGGTVCAFDKADANKDGKLTLEEFATTMKKQNEAQKSAEAPQAAQAPAGGAPAGKCGGAGGCGGEDDEEKKAQELAEKLGISVEDAKKLLQAAKSDPELDGLINNALGGDKNAINSLKSKAKEILGSGNDNFSSLMSQYSPPVDMANRYAA